VHEHSQHDDAVAAAAREWQTQDLRALQEQPEVRTLQHELATARAARGPPFDPLLFSHALYPGADAEKLREEVLALQAALRL